jgi:8-oxo-dGTP pyrophosphatase MutT (NUDIX family)
VKSSALIVLELPTGELVLQRRTDNAPLGPGKLGLFGGGIEAGESPYECIVRELGEETSLDVGRLSINFVRCYELQNPNRCSYLFWTFVESAEFRVYEGKWAEVHTPEALRVRDDLTRTLQLVVNDLG